MLTLEHDFVMPRVNGVVGIAPCHMGRGQDGHSVESGSTPGKAMLAGILDQTPRHRVCLKPSSSGAAELDRDAFGTDSHDMCPR